MGQANCSSCSCAKQGHPVISILEGETVSKPEWRVSAEEPCDVPDWLAALMPSIAPEQAEQAIGEWHRFGEDLRARAHTFAQRAICGIPCHFINQPSGHVVPAKYSLDTSLTTLTVRALGVEQSPRLQVDCQLAEVRNIWVATDSQLVRRFHRLVRSGTLGVELSRLLLIDALSGPISIVEQSTETREDFLDCMAVLIAAHRLRSEPEAACCRRTGGLPPPEAQLRPVGQSLQSEHVSGPICTWLAKAGEDVIDAFARRGQDDFVKASPRSELTNPRPASSLNASPRSEIQSPRATLGPIKASPPSELTNPRPASSFNASPRSETHTSSPAFAPVKASPRSERSTPRSTAGSVSL